MRRLALVLWMVVAPALAWGQAAPQPLSAEEAAPVVRHFYDALHAVMKDGPALGFDGRAQRLAPAVEAAYDLPGMLRAALGGAAAGLTSAQRDELTQAFGRYTVASYAAQFTADDGERFETEPARPARGGPGGDVLVPSRIVPKDGEATEIDYLMRAVDGQWKIADVLLNGTVSQLAMRRSEFVSTLRRDGVGGLRDLLLRGAAEPARR